MCPPPPPTYRSSAAPDLTVHFQYFVTVYYIINFLVLEILSRKPKVLAKSIPMNSTNWKRFPYIDCQYFQVYISAYAVPLNLLYQQIVKSL